jgi:hypothetical protein
MTKDNKALLRGRQESDSSGYRTKSDLRSSDPHIVELHRLVRASLKFQRWKPELRPEDLNPKFGVATEEKHFSPAELAKVWGVSQQTIREIFKDEPGVLVIGRSGTRFRRGYKTMRIPQSVAERVHARHCN